MADSSTPDAAVAALLRLLELAPGDGAGAGAGRWRGMRKPDGIGRVFGGQVVGQALMAATAEVDPAFAVHSLHAYFLRAGDEDHAIDFTVAAEFDGRSFANRRVVAFQNDRPILTLAASFHRDEPGLRRHAAMPDAPPPEALPTYIDFMVGLGRQMSPRLMRMLGPGTAIDFRVVPQSFVAAAAGTAPRPMLWFRLVAPAAVAQPVQRALLAYSSDYHLLAAALLHHGDATRPRPFQMASLDHAVWFHGDVRMDEWMLYALDSPWTGGARGFSRGTIYARTGEMIASVAQEGLVRPSRS